MNWKETLNLKPILDKWDYEVDVEQTKKEFAEEIGKSKRLPVERLLSQLEDFHCIDDIDSWLDEVYDEADRAKVWMGAI